jgi:hypothetical protein
MIKYKLMVAIISTALLLTACGSSQPQVTASTPGQEIKGSEQSTGSNSGENSSNAGQNQGREQERPDVYGRVKSIIGNEVVLELAEMPQRRTGQSGGSATAGNQSGQIPPSGGSQMGGGQGERPTVQRELKLTGETLTLLIPVGVPITSFSQGGMKQLDIADIYEGTMMQVWYDKNDEASKTIVRIMAVQGR